MWAWHSIKLEEEKKSFLEVGYSLIEYNSRTGPAAISETIETCPNSQGMVRLREDSPV